MSKSREEFVLKGQLKDIENLIEQKANKGSVKDALHWKVNKVDLESCLKSYVSVDRL